MTTTKAPKIKRCPGCGAKPPVVKVFQGGLGAQVKCTSRSFRDGQCVEGAWGDRSMGWTDADAIAAWNRLPRRKRVGRKKAEAAVDAFVSAVGDASILEFRVGLVGFDGLAGGRERVDAANREAVAARAHVLALMGHGADADAGAGGAG